MIMRRTMLSAAVAAILLVVVGIGYAARSVTGSAQMTVRRAAAMPPTAAGPASSRGESSWTGTARREVTVDLRRQQLMNVRTVSVTRGALERSVRAVGLVRYDESRLVDVNLKVEGWIQDLRVDYTGQRVRKGQPLFTVYSPELVTLQTEYVVAMKTRDQIALTAPDGRQRVDDFVTAARRRLELKDVPADEIRALDASHEARGSVRFLAPASGFIIDKQAVKGLHVMAGQSLFKIADLSVVWIEADVYEQELPYVVVGSR